MTERSKTKTWKYALVVFLETEEIGIIKTATISSTKPEIDDYVTIMWNTTERYIGRVLSLAGTVYKLPRRFCMSR